MFKYYSKKLSILGSPEQQLQFRTGDIAYIPLAQVDTDWDYMVTSRLKDGFLFSLLCRITNIDLYCFNSLFQLNLNRGDTKAVDKAFTALTIPLMK
jgi:hypothetical protein